MVQYPTTEAEVWDRVKTVYWDMSELSPNSGVFGISSSEVKVVPAGTTFNVMSAREREQTPQYGEPFRVSSSMKEFARRLLAEEDWRELWEPAQELALYPSKEAAARAVELVPLSELLPKDWKGAEER